MIWQCSWHNRQKFNVFHVRVVYANDTHTHTNTNTVHSIPTLDRMLCHSNQKPLFGIIWHESIHVPVVAHSQVIACNTAINIDIIELSPNVCDLFNVELCSMRIVICRSKTHMFTISTVCFCLLNKQPTHTHTKKCWKLSKISSAPLVIMMITI